MLERLVIRQMLIRQPFVAVKCTFAFVFKGRKYKLYLQTNYIERKCTVDSS